VTGVPLNASVSVIDHLGLYTARITLRTDCGFDIIWQYYPTINFERSLEDFYDAPNSDGSYGDVTFYDQKLPKKVVTLVTHGANLGEAQQWEAFFDEAGGVATVRVA